MDGKYVEVKGKFSFNFEDNTYTPPIVVDNEGNSLNDQCVGFNTSTFWGKGYHTSTQHPERIHTLSFEIVPKNKAGQKQCYGKVGFIELLDTTKLLTSKYFCQQCIYKVMAGG